MWTAKDVIKQVKEKAIPIFEITHPGFIAIFAFDNSTGHQAFAEDVLNVRIQYMNFPNDYYDEEKRGQPKGIKLCILQERGLWKDNLLKTCSKYSKNKQSH